MVWATTTTSVSSGSSATSSGRDTTRPRPWAWPNSPTTSGWLASPTMTTSAPRLAALAMMACTLITRGQVPSTIWLKPACFRRVLSWGGTPWALMITVPPVTLPGGGISFRAWMPLLSKSSSTWGLWIKGP